MKRQKKKQNKMLNIGATISALFFLWLLVSALHIGFTDSLGERNFPQWNAFVILSNLSIDK